MKPTYEGFAAKRSSGFAQVPPVGHYVGEIQGVKTEDSFDHSRENIVLMLEITEGQYAGQYHKVYEEQKESFGDSVMYKGSLRLTPPIDGDEPWVREKFEDQICCIQESNADYHWDWDEKKLKGLKVGFSVRTLKYTGQDGSQKETTEIARLQSIDDVRAGKLKILKERVKKPTNTAKKATDVTGQVEVPF